MRKIYCLSVFFLTLVLSSCNESSANKDFISKCRDGIIEDHFTNAKPGQHDVETISELSEKIANKDGVKYLTLTTRGNPPFINCKQEGGKVYTQEGVFPWHEVDGKTE